MKKRVFVLEDNPELRELFIILLEEESYQVDAFPNVKIFNEIVQSDLPDVFLLDIRLPDGNGVEICQELKNSLRTKHIPVIMMSAHANLAEIKQECEAEAFIQKPFDINDFIYKVQQYA